MESDSDSMNNLLEHDETQPLLGSQRPKSPEILRYPRSIPFIISNEFCERFNYYGLRTILLIYLTQKLMYSDSDAAVIFHLSSMSVYLCSLLGAIIADSFWGKYSTILWLSIVYVIGSLVVALGSVEVWNMPANELTMIGLLLIAIGSGGIKPCVSAFGGEQFKLPEQAAQLAKFFPMFYFAINVGSVLTTFITPLLRNMRCFGMDECFVAGFGVPAILMFCSVVIFICGSSMYRKVELQGNMFVRVCSCIGNAISTKYRESSFNFKSHWLDYAEVKHGRKLVTETKILLNVLVLYLPLPLFWALFNQQGSRWTEQALRMNGSVPYFISNGSALYFEIQPDQIQMANPLLILLLIPLFEVAFYPLLRIFGIYRPLQKMTFGGILAAVAFVLSMLVQIQIDNSPEKSVCMLWQLPQYVVMTLAEVMFSVTGLEFSFTQAPESMKSVLQAFWMLTVACGDLIVTLVVSSKILEDQAMEFLLFAGLMFVDILIFLILALRYKTIAPETIRNLTEL